LAAEIAFDLQKEAVIGEHATAPNSRGNVLGIDQRPPPLSTSAAALPHIAGASKRKSLGTMMKPAPAPIENGDSDAVAQLPAAAALKTRRSSIAEARRASAVGHNVSPASAFQRRSSGEKRLPLQIAAKQGMEPIQAVAPEDDDKDWQPSLRSSKRRKVAVPKRRQARVEAAGA